MKFWANLRTIRLEPLNSPTRIASSIFSSTKFNNVKIINDGGWHFTNIKTPKEIELKFRSYLHHREFDEQPLSVEEIDKIIKNKQAIYDLKVDKTVNKIGNGSKLEKFEINKLPNYIQANKDNLKKLTEEAFQKEIFGAPTFIVNNKLFWGQDRLEFLERALKNA